MKFFEVISNWKDREIPFKNNQILNLGYESWEEFRFSKLKDHPGNLVRNRVNLLLDPDQDFVIFDFDYGLLTKSFFAPFKKWNCFDSQSSLSCINLSSAYLNVYNNNLWTPAYSFALNRMHNNLELSLVGVYSKNLDRIMIVDGCETLIAYLKMLSTGYIPLTCKIYMQTIDESLENLFFNIYNL
tara:strand:- start:1166 stop:1720 length:555 start_codon:yes stop_codon:yes gene_type:complete